MDLTLVLLIILLLVVIGLFVVALRSLSPSQADRGVAPRQQSPRGAPALPGSPRRTEDAVPAPAGQAPMPAAMARMASEGGTSDGAPPIVATHGQAPGSERVGLGAATSEARSTGGTGSASSVGGAGGHTGTAAIRIEASVPTTTVAGRDESAETATSAAAEEAPPAGRAGLPGEGAHPGTERVIPPARTHEPGALELVGQPLTRSGDVRLAAAPRRLPYRLAELLGEQRQLEEAITVANRRIEEVELGPEPASIENRVRLGVLRQDLMQKQERLREVLFLQDGYRWLQQQMAPDRALAASEK